MQTKDHWEDVYSSKAADAVSWYQARADRSLRMIRDTGVSASAAIIDVGGGASTLVRDLRDEGYHNLAVIDLSAAALAISREALGVWGGSVHWIEGDITNISLPAAGFDVWHDRAVFHFLTEPDDRARYADRLAGALKPGGHIIIATFAEDGPERCSGLPVVRYTPEELQAELGSRFSLVSSQKEAHHTPSGSVQQFVYCYFRKKSS